MKIGCATGCGGGGGGGGGGLLNTSSSSRGLVGFLIGGSAILMGTAEGGFPPSSGGLSINPPP